MVWFGVGVLLVLVVAISDIASTISGYYGRL
jgi:hypothetical protein